ncbi:MAG: phosphatase PAP2 family protein [Bacteroidales bacterium]|nr:phosphatase PAP2 family protein [Bacteroidales bacterium]
MQNQSTYKRIISSLNSTDIVTLGYLIITLVYILLSSGRLNGEFAHILFRIIVISLICWSAWLSPKISSRFILFFRSIYPFILFGAFYSETDYLNNILFNNLDSIVEKVELWIFGLHPSIVFSKYFPQKWFSELMNFGYFSYYFLIILLPFWLFIRRRDSFQYVVFTITTTFYLFYLFFIIFPVAGPQFYLEESLRTIPNSGIFRELVKFAEWVGEGSTAAFPSSHVGMVAIIGYLAYKYAEKLLFVYMIFGLLICFSTVYIKAHYAIDVIGGIVFAPVFLGLSNRLNKCFK